MKELPANEQRYLNDLIVYTINKADMSTYVQTVARLSRHCRNGYDTEVYDNWVLYEVVPVFRRWYETFKK
jgi:hypothetical protein